MLNVGPKVHCVPPPATRTAWWLWCTMKVFRLVLTPRYSTTFGRTWEDVLRGFRGTIYAWKERKLDSMVERAQVPLAFSSPSCGT